jgi:SAM-dependent methyltransferase
VSTSSTTINRDFYQGSYNLAGKKAVWRKHLSFDQQSKFRLNWKLLGEWVREGNSIYRVLEVGCGFGLTLCKFPKDVLLVGTDISYNAAKLLHQACVNQGRRAVICVNDSVGHLPFDTGFDVIICSHVLEHVPDDVSLLCEFRRLIAPTGVVLLNVPINEEMPDAKHVRRYEEKTLCQKVSEAGFRTVKQVTADRWSAFFLQWRAKRGDGIDLKAMRASCALLPYHVSERLGTMLLGQLPFQQLAVLAVPE